MSQEERKIKPAERAYTEKELVRKLGSGFSAGFSSPIRRQMLFSVSRFPYSYTHIKEIEDRDFSLKSLLTCKLLKQVNLF